MLRQFVVSHQEEAWWVTSVGLRERSFASRDEALQAAEHLARQAFCQGDDCQVLTVDERGAARQCCTYGCHPDAPYHLH